MTTTREKIDSLTTQINSQSQPFRQIVSEVNRVLVGQDALMHRMLVGLLTGGHLLIEGVPGLAKTTAVASLAKAVNTGFQRLQFTPDLLPADITGTEVIQEDRSSGAREFRFLPGPVFANIVLADEINRTPPKTQAALLEAMQEQQVTIGGQRHELPQPFFVLATQNPIEQEGTYSLPEAQLDRFMIMILVDYPGEDEELEIVKRTTADIVPSITSTLSAAQILELSHIVKRVPVADHLAKYAIQFARRTRSENSDAPDVVRQYVHWGAGPRASQYMILAAKARAVLHGRYYVSSDDIRAVATPVLRHRIVTNFNAEAEGVSADDIVHQLAATIPVAGDDETAVG